MVEKRAENLANLCEKAMQAKAGATKVTSRNCARIIDELEATLDAIGAEMEVLGALARGSRSRLFLALHERSRQAREWLFAMVDAEAATSTKLRGTGRDAGRVDGLGLIDGQQGLAVRRGTQHATSISGLTSMVCPVGEQQDARLECVPTRVSLVCSWQRPPRAAGAGGSRHFAPRKDSSALGPLEHPPPLAVGLAPRVGLHLAPVPAVARLVGRAAPLADHAFKARASQLPTTAPRHP